MLFLYCLYCNRLERVFVTLFRFLCKLKLEISPPYIFFYALCILSVDKALRLRSSAIVFCFGRRVVVFPLLRGLHSLIV